MKTKCKTVHSTGIHRRVCGKPSTGPDGMCTRCRNLFAPKPYTCRACGTSGLQRDVSLPLCADHKTS